MLSHPSKLTERRLMISIAITGFILIVEVAGGLWTGSLALLSDAAHVFLDIFALVLSYSALRLSSLPPTDNFTFGYHRFEVFASLINWITLALISAGILWEAYRRFLTRWLSYWAAMKIRCAGPAGLQIRDDRPSAFVPIALKNV